MIRNNNTSSETAMIDVMQQPAPDRSPLGPREIDQLQDIIIRAHYLSMELRDICAEADIGSRHMCLFAGDVLKRWALAFAQELEKTVNPPGSP